LWGLWAKPRAVGNPAGFSTASEALRRCASPTCYWLFLDETKNCSRRWCEMASCGNLMKVRRHRAKQHQSA
ncbi:MAG: CGNR zinc finger domain-containing protein, partial [Betaproteobacteria bacterium]